MNISATLPSAGESGSCETFSVYAGI